MLFWNDLGSSFKTKHILLHDHSIAYAKLFRCQFRHQHKNEHDRIKKRNGSYVNRAHLKASIRRNDLQSRLRSSKPSDKQDNRKTTKMLHNLSCSLQGNTIEGTFHKINFYPLDKYSLSIAMKLRRRYLIGTIISSFVYMPQSTDALSCRRLNGYDLRKCLR